MLVHHPHFSSAQQPPQLKRSFGCEQLLDLQSNHQSFPTLELHTAFHTLHTPFLTFLGNGCMDSHPTVAPRRAVSRLPLCSWPVRRDIAPSEQTFRWHIQHAAVRSIYTVVVTIGKLVNEIRRCNNVSTSLNSLSPTGKYCLFTMQCSPAA